MKAKFLEKVMEQTAVNYLVEQLLPKALTEEQYYHIQRAKEMEKKQIIDAYGVKVSHDDPNANMIFL